MDAPADQDTVQKVAYRLRCWGQFALRERASGADRTPRSRKARALIALLARQADGRASRERLCALLWSTRGEDQARASLRQVLHELRPLSAGAEPLLSAGRDHVELRLSLIETEIQLLTGPEHRADIAARMHMLNDPEAVLYGDLSGCDPAFDDWLNAERAGARDQLHELAITAAEQSLSKGDTATARELVSMLERVDPTDEEAVRIGLRIDHRRGNLSGLARRHQRLCAALRQDLQIAPSAETENLYQTLLAAREPAVTAPAVGTASIAATPSRFPRTTAWRRSRWTVIVVAILLAAGLAWSALRLQPNAGREAAAVAVMPFRSLPAGKDDYFAEGVSEEVRSLLARNPKLSVLGQTSSAALGSQGLDARALGRKLGVAYLLEGTMRAAGERVRVDVSLVRTSDGVQLWSERHEGRRGDIFAIQDRIGAAVARRLRAGPAAPAADTTTTTRDDVYNLYLAARNFARVRTAERNQLAEELLQRALSIDPDFAPAWAELGEAHWFATGNEHPLPRQQAAAAASERHIRRALELAPDLAQAHATLGLILLESRPREAEAHLKRALAIDPSDGEAWNWYGNLLAQRDDFDKAFAAHRRAFEADPLYTGSFLNLVQALQLRGRFGDIDAALGRVEVVDPNPARRIIVSTAPFEARGDLSQMARRLKAARDLRQAPYSSLAAMKLEETLMLLGHEGPWRSNSKVSTEIVRLRQLQPPTSAALREDYPDARDFWSNERASHGGAAFGRGGQLICSLIAPLLVAHGRSSELVALYGGAFASPEAMSAAIVGSPDFYYLAAETAVALRTVGRAHDAERLLAVARARASRMPRATSPLPFDYSLGLAALHAVSGDRARAIMLLEAARQRGWLDEPRWLRIDPAFTPLRDIPRFKRLVADIEANLSRERRELGPEPF